MKNEKMNGDVFEKLMKNELVDAVSESESEAADEKSENNNE